MPVRIVAKQSIMIIDRQVTQRLAVVEEKPVARLAAVDNFTGDDRQPGQQVVTFAPQKFRAQRGCPIDVLNFPTVGVKIFQGFARERPGIRDQRFHQGIPVALKRAGVIDVQGIRIMHCTRRPLPAVACRRNVGMVANRIAKAQDLPVTGGNIPV